MIDLNDYFYFVYVVEHRGFAPAARALDIPKSRLSRHIQQLEERLGARLLQRTSRRFAITDVGQTFFRHARAMVDEMEAAEATVNRQTTTLAGPVRVSCSVAMAQWVLQDMFLDFLKLHPKVSLIEQVTNQHVDLLESGIDLAIRAHTGPLPDSNLIQRQLMPAPWHLYAGYRYLQEFGSPESPQSLHEHSGLKLGWKPASGQWQLRNTQGVKASIPFQPRLCSDDIETLKRAAIDGHGIVALPAYLCRPEVERGELIRLLPDWTAGDAEVSLLLPSRRGLMPAVSALADYLVEACAIYR
ncbi:DNA-binding transcriptional LysR family regulator [Litorivivens lipolytica]|uniref:DNA-binding transcriptional LysR family regulator n=1 Tax=Litorivivens lipolytica TaxID=1524264 RepID=A0A7W4Z6G5_9GAMM|nr:LysR substrate-binding domain-containing protein [Litorivivens lipolytica]MBB3048243.1 DNA-binding transcriptional LysR family regulator [Litorivivens lipolytica]